MKLYLSSYLLPDVEAFSKFVGKKPESIKLGVILNSKDCKSPSERSERVRELIKYFLERGMSSEEIDLRNYPSGKNLLNEFRRFDALWFLGGNTFCLRWAMEMSDCKNVLKQALGEGIVYAGDSAGAIVVGPTLKYFDNADDPKLAPKAIYDGLAFVDFSVLPHWNSQKYGQFVKETKEKLQAEGHKTKELEDGDYLLIEDGVIIDK